MRSAAAKTQLVVKQLRPNGAGKGDCFIGRFVGTTIGKVAPGVSVYYL